MAESLPKVKQTNYIPVILTSQCVRRTSSWLTWSTEEVKRKPRPAPALTFGQKEVKLEAMSDPGFTFFDPPSREEEIVRVLTALASGTYRPEDLEATSVDLKEEAGRRSGSHVLHGQPQSEAVAKQIAQEAACMANTEGGGALIVGVDDRTGQLIGSDTDADWLRRRLYELTERKLSTEIRQVRIAGTRLLVISVPQAVEPVPFNGRYRQRVGRSCVLVTSTELLQGLFAGAAADPSHRRSGHSMDDIAEGAVASLRRRISVVDRFKASLDLRDLLAPARTAPRRHRFSQHGW